MSAYGFAQKLAAILASTAIASLLGLARPALAQEAAPAWTVEAAYTVDAVAAVDGAASRDISVLDNLDLVADLDLERAVGWRDATFHAYVLANNGDIPNDLAGTLQGVDNIEVERQGVRLYEVWIEAPVGPATTVLGGLYDLNSEFYANDSAGLLISPSFGIGSELAATGPNGPSIFPSTAMALRVNHDFEGGYARAAVLNAHAGVPGDPGGVDLSFDGGALLIAEAGLTGAGRLAVGAWRYTDRQDDIRDLAPGGGPERRRAEGAYVLAERVLSGEADGEGRRVTGFFRAGISDGRTSPFRGGWQAGLLVERAFAGRPDSAWSVGVQQGALSSQMRANLADGGTDAAGSEYGVEFTVSDRISDRLTIQPDLQLIFNPGGDSDADPVVVLGVRLSIALTGG